MSLQSQLADAGLVRQQAIALVDLLTKAIAIQDAGGNYTPSDMPEVTWLLTASQQQVGLALIASKWTALKTAANRN